MEHFEIYASVDYHLSDYNGLADIIKTFKAKTKLYNLFRLELNKIRLLTDNKSFTHEEKVAAYVQLFKGHNVFYNFYRVYEQLDSLTFNEKIEKAIEDYIFELTKVSNLAMNKKYRRLFAEDFRSFLISNQQDVKPQKTIIILPEQEEIVIAETDIQKEKDSKSVDTQKQMLTERENELQKMFMNTIEEKTIVINPALLQKIKFTEIVKKGMIYNNNNFSEKNDRSQRDLTLLLLILQKHNIITFTYRERAKSIRETCKAIIDELPDAGVISRFFNFINKNETNTISPNDIYSYEFMDDLIHKFTNIK